MLGFGFNLYLLYILSYFLRFASRWPMLSRLRFDFILVGVLLGLALITAFRLDKPKPSGPSRFLKILFVYMILSLPLVKWPGSVIRFGFEFYLQAFIFFLFTVMFVDNKKKLKITIWFFLCCQLVRIIEPAYLHITEGYWGSLAYSMSSGSLTHLNRLSSGPHDVLNPTQFAGLIVTTIPFIYFLLFKSPKKILKLLSLIIVPVSLYVLFLTGARSGVICLLVVLFAIIFNEFDKKINFKMVVLSTVIVSSLLLVSFSLLPDEFKERYISVIDSNAVGADTAQGRIKGLKASFLDLFTARFFFGYGLGTSAEANYHLRGSAIRSHSFYVEIIQELGIFGFIIFLKYIQAIFKSLKTAKEHFKLNIEENKEDFFLLSLNKAIHAWALMFLVYSIICFGLSSWEWYFFGALAVLCERYSMPQPDEYCDDQLSDQSE
ncbi:MAG: O-antigen ligase family protein [Thermodesulfobacteriota bacterium]|nr:O-antigen ligase family protein [Thermodesulfobacteriota bacterium]